MRKLLLFPFIFLLLSISSAHAAGEAFTKLWHFPGGATYAITMKGDVLFTATGPLIEVWKITGSGTAPINYMAWPGTNEVIPQKIGELNFEDYEIGGLEISGNYLYIGTEKGLAIADISNPYSPKHVSTYYKELYGRMKAVNNRLYVSTDFPNAEKKGTHKLVILDISNPTNPVELGSFNSPAEVILGNMDRFAVSGNYAYLAYVFNLNPAYVLVVDISDPFNIREVSRIKTTIYVGVSAVEVDESRNLLFALEYRTGLHAYNISNPANPVKLSYFGGTSGATGPLENAAGMKIKGNYAYMSAFYSGVYVVDISNPSNMTFVGTSFATSRFGYAYDILLNGDYAYVSNMGGGFSIFNIVNPPNPKYVLQLDTHGIFYDVVLKDNYLYATADYELMVFDVSDISSPKHISSLEWARASIGGVKGNYIFLDGGWRELAVIDVSDPANPKLAGKYSDHTEVGIIVNDTMYLARNPGGKYELHILDISNLPNVTVKGIYTVSTSSGSSNSVAVKNNYVYFGDADGIKILDASNPSAVVQVGSFMNGSRALRMIAQGNYLYALSDYYLFTFDISNPTNPVQKNRLDNRGWHLGGFYGAGQLTFVTWKNYLVSNGDTVVMWDISNPSQPIISREYKLPVSSPGEGAGFYFADNLFFDALQYKGIYIYNYGPPDNSSPQIFGIAAVSTEYYANITWNTDETANGIISYGTASGIYTKQASDGFRTEHSINLANLEQNTTYYYIAESKDFSGNSARSAERTFTTLHDPVMPGWRDGFDDESKISLKESTLIKNGDVTLLFPNFRLAPRKDARISPINGRSTGTQDLSVGDSDRYRTVMEFTLPASNGRIDSARLYLDENNVQNPTVSQTYNVHLLTSGSFDEATVNWTNRNPAQAWAAQGGDFSTSVIDHFVAAGDLTGKQVNFTLRGADADNSLSSLNWGDTISLLIKQSVTGGYNARNDWFRSGYIEILPSLVEGTMTSIQIYLPSAYSWNRFYATATTPVGTSIIFSVSDASTGSVLCTGLTGLGDDVSACLSGAASVKLQANLSTANPHITPAVSDWKITWNAGSPRNAYLGLLSYFYSNGTVSDAESTAGKQLTGISALPTSGRVSIMASRFNTSFANFSADAAGGYVGFNLAGMKPNTSYRVLRDGVLKEVIRADALGRIGFNSSVW